MSTMAFLPNWFAPDALTCRSLLRGDNPSPFLFCCQNSLQDVILNYSYILTTIPFHHTSKYFRRLHCIQQQHFSFLSFHNLLRLRIPRLRSKGSNNPMPRDATTQTTQVPPLKLKRCLVPARKSDSYRDHTTALARCHYCSRTRPGERSRERGPPWRPTVHPMYLILLWH